MIAECGINYEIAGEGDKCILCMHGWGGQIDSFKPLIRDIAAQQGAARVLAVDFPGHGLTPEPDDVWTVDDFKAQILALLDELNLDRVHVVAHSFGGRVALKLGAENPERVDRMVLTGCAGLPPEQSAARKLRNRVINGVKAGFESDAAQKLLGDNADKLLDALQTRLGSADYKSLSKRMRSTFVNVVNQDLSACLPLIKAPTFLFWGEKDTATPLWMGQRMEREIADAALTVVPGGTHFAYLEAYPQFLAITKAFLL